MILSINIIGAGRLGQTLGHLLVKNQLVRIESVCNRSEASTINAIQFMGQGRSCTAINKLSPADITFITTPDDQIATVCDELSKNPFIKPKSIVLHCSGSLTSDALTSVRNKDCYAVSMHPMHSFSLPELSIEHYPGTYCAIEGDKEAVLTICSLFNAIGSITYEIEKEKKLMYHIAGVFASNYLVTLAQQSLSCMNDAGVENSIAMHVITHLMRSTVSNLEKTLSPEQSLTGPIQRGDIPTIRNHIESLTCNEQKNLYADLGKATLQLTEHDEAKKQTILRAVTQVVAL